MSASGLLSNVSALRIPDGFFQVKTGCHPDAGRGNNLNSRFKSGQMPWHGSCVTSSVVRTGQ